MTIEHRVVSDVTTPMKQDDARRLADRVFGDDKTEVPLGGDGVHWARTRSRAETNDTP
ncbi:MAG TPA: hypothetical protein VNC61_15615 [Acidimicrobiales bacterium]|nr:hypothetical protein [Acidimicrobiales bacterium]